MEIKVYILKKDTPSIKAGAKFILNENGLYCTESMQTKILNDKCVLHYPAYHKDIVENNPEWFEKEVSILENIVAKYTAGLPIYQSHKFASQIKHTMAEAANEYLRETLFEILEPLKKERAFTCSELRRRGLDFAIERIYKYLKP